MLGRIWSDVRMGDSSGNGMARVGDLESTYNAKEIVLLGFFVFLFSLFFSSDKLVMSVWRQP